MKEFKRIIRKQSLILLCVSIFSINIGIFIYFQFPHFDILTKCKETSIYHDIIKSYKETPLDANEVENKRNEATAYAILQNPKSPFFEFYKQEYPDIWLSVANGNNYNNAVFYESAYTLLKEQIDYFNEQENRYSNMEKEFITKSNSSIFRKQKYTLLAMEKTLLDFKNISNINYTAGDDRVLLSIIDSPYTDLLFFLFLLFICLEFVSERKTGLWEIVNSTKRGRAYLGVQRLSCRECITNCVNGNNLQQI